jgi:hypothetical protein
MATLKFGVWIPTYAWADAGPEHVRRIAESIHRCEEYGFDIWVIDHLLSAPGLYGVALTIARPSRRRGSRSCASWEPTAPTTTSRSAT